MLKRFFVALALTGLVTSPAAAECVGNCEVTESGVYIEGVKVVGAQQPAVNDADGTLASVTSTINAALDRMRTHGLIASGQNTEPPFLWHKTSLRAPSVQTIVNSTWSAVYFTAEARDTDAMHSVTTNPHLVTINTAGDYDATASVCFAANSTGARGLKFVVTSAAGVLEVQGPQVTAVGGGKLTCIGHPMVILPLTVGTTIEVQVYQDADSNVSLELFPNKSTFSVGMR